MNRMGTWNVRGINVEEKRREVMDVFRKGKFDLLAVTETKMKGKGEVEWCGVKCVCVCVLVWKGMGEEEKELQF